MPDNTKQRLLFITLSLLGVILILFFGVRAFRTFNKFDRHRPPPFAGEIQTDVETIEEWMTIPFISHNYGVPPKVIFNALGIDPKENDDFKKSLEQLNEEYFPDADDYVLVTVKATVLAHQPPPTPALPDPALSPLTPAPPQATP